MNTRTAAIALSMAIVVCVAATLGVVAIKKSSTPPTESPSGQSDPPTGKKSSTPPTESPSGQSDPPTGKKSSTPDPTPTPTATPVPGSLPITAQDMQMSTDIDGSGVEVVARDATFTIAPSKMRLTFNDLNDVVRYYQWEYPILPDGSIIRNQRVDDRLSQAADQHSATVVETMHYLMQRIGELPEPANVNTNGLYDRVQKVEEDVGELRTDVGELRTEVRNLDTRFNGLEKKVNELPSAEDNARAFAEILKTQQAQNPGGGQSADPHSSNQPPATSSEDNCQ